MHICFFEDSTLKRFHPLALTRPLDDLRLGILTLGKKWERELDVSGTSRLVRSQLTEVFNSDPIPEDKPVFWINPRALPSDDLVNRIEELETGSCIMHGNHPLAAKVDGQVSKEWFETGKPDFGSLFVVKTEKDTVISHIWELYQLNSGEISADIGRLGATGSDEVSVSEHAVLVNEDEIIMEPGVAVEPGVVLTAEDGPVYLGRNVTVMAGSVLRGPVAVCDGATIKMGAKIYGSTTIGPVCKVAGEVTNSIFHSYSNKGHDGFVGHSLIGQWCNFGADTNTSNLKNNYSHVRLTDWETMQEKETGQQFIGTIAGDHTKTAINTQLNTGTICGVSCNIFTDTFPPKFMASFSWVGANVIQPYRLDKALETMQAMMKRRDVEMTGEYRTLMKYIFDHRKEL